MARDLTKPFRSTNPTWLRKADVEAERVSADRQVSESLFITQIEAMTQVLSLGMTRNAAEQPFEIRVAGSTSPQSKSL